MQSKPCAPAHSGVTNSMRSVSGAPRHETVRLSYAGQGGGSIHFPGARRLDVPHSASGERLAWATLGLLIDTRHAVTHRIANSVHGTEFGLGCCAQLNIYLIQPGDERAEGFVASHIAVFAGDIADDLYSARDAARNASHANRAA